MLHIPQKRNNLLIIGHKAGSTNVTAHAGKEDPVAECPINFMELKDASTEELMTELLDRCSPAIFIGSRNEGMDDGGRMTFFHYRGNPAVCYGMCHELAYTIQTEQAHKI